MLGFATAIDTEEVLLEKRHICPKLRGFLGRLSLYPTYRFIFKFTLIITEGGTMRHLGNT